MLNTQYNVSQQPNNTLIGKGTTRLVKASRLQIGGMLRSNKAGQIIRDIYLHKLELGELSKLKGHPLKGVEVLLVNPFESNLSLMLVTGTKVNGEFEVGKRTFAAVMCEIEEIILSALNDFCGGVKYIRTAPLLTQSSKSIPLNDLLDGRDIHLALEYVRKQTNSHRVFIYPTLMTEQIFNDLMGYKSNLIPIDVRVMNFNPSLKQFEQWLRYNKSTK